MFDDLIEANLSYSESFQLRGLAARAARGLAVVTCIDSRIEPLKMLGLRPGDAKVLRNAGARVTEDVLRSLVLAVNLLGVERVCVVQHTECRMSQSSNEEVVATIGQLRGVDASDWDFLVIDDQDQVLASDVERIRACPLLPSDLAVAGFVYDVETGLLRRVHC
ncbi:MAG: carbonic anhydrase [Actinomycetota bacterium]